jgi:hypothetical protein
MGIEFRRIPQNLKKKSFREFRGIPHYSLQGIPKFPASLEVAPKQVLKYLNERVHVHENELEHVHVHTNAHKLGHVQYTSMYMFMYIFM